VLHPYPYPCPFPLSSVPAPAPSPLQKENLFDASKRFTRLPYWNGTGANHLLLSYADYGASVHLSIQRRPCVSLAPRLVPIHPPASRLPCVAH